MRGWVVRVADRMRRVWWRVARPQTLGVKVAVRVEGGVLLVRHAYSDRRLALPGGRVRRGESVRAAASREAAEELGVEIDEAVWQLVGVFQNDTEHKRDLIIVLSHAVDDPGPLATTSAEIAEIRVVALGEPGVSPATGRILTLLDDEHPAGGGAPFGTW